MSIISRDLLASDPQRVVFSPSVLVHMRQRQVSYTTYFELLTQDMAQGLSPKEWGDRLAEEGKLTVARECWRRSGQPLEEIHEKYKQEYARWSKHIVSMLSTLQKSCTKLQRFKGLKPEDEEHYDDRLAEAAKYAKQAWFDLTQETLADLQEYLDQLNAVI